MAALAAKIVSLPLAKWQSENSKKARRNLKTPKFSKLLENFPGDSNGKNGLIESTSVCNGDSGGGMVFRMNGIYYLRGLVSLSVARSNEYRCDPTHYVIFTDLAKFLPWIHATVSDF